MRKLIILGATISTIGLISPLQAKAQNVDENSDSLIDSAATIDAYVNMFPNASRAEAEAIMSREMLTTIMQVRNCAQKDDAFAGLTIRHEPKYKVVVKFKNRPKYRLEQCTKRSNCAR